MSAQNLVPACLGKFQTRSSRIVEITGTREVPVAITGGGTKMKRVFVGHIFKQDGRTVDTQLLWEESGASHNSRGVATDKDLCILVKRADPEPAPVVEEVAAEVVTDTADEDAHKAKVQEWVDEIGLVLADEVEPEDTTPVVTLRRVILERDCAESDLRKSTDTNGELVHELAKSNTELVTLRSELGAINASIEPYRQGDESNGAALARILSENATLKQAAEPKLSADPAPVESAHSHKKHK